MLRRSARKSAGQETPEKLLVGARELEDIYLGDVKYGAGDVSPRARMARQKVQGVHHVDASDNSLNQQRNTRDCNRNEPRTFNKFKTDEPIDPPSPAASLRTLVLNDDADDAEPPEDMLKIPSFPGEEEPAGKLAPSPSLVIQPGGLYGLPTKSLRTTDTLSVWEKIFFVFCVVPIILATSVQLVTTSTTSYYEFSAISRESAATLSTLLHATIDSWLVPLVEICFEVFEADMVPLLHLLVDTVAWMVAHSMQLLLLAMVLVALRLMRACRAAAM